MKKKTLLKTTFGALMCATSLVTLASCNDKPIDPTDSVVQPAKSYTVTFKDYDGTVLKTMSVEENKSISYTGANPSRDGYTFKGWDKTNDGVADSLGTATSDVTFVAVYEKVSTPTPTPTPPLTPTPNPTPTPDPEPVAKYTVTYVINGHGSQPEALTDVTSLPSKLPTMSDDDYDFDGWYINEALTEVAVPGMSLDSNLTLYAKWSPKAVETLKVTFYNYDNSPLYSVDVPKKAIYIRVFDLYTGSTPTRPSDSTYDYSFAGWSENANATVPDSDLIADLSTYHRDINLYAVYSKTFVKNDNDDTDDYHKLITDSYYDTSKSWSRISYVDYERSQTRSVIEEKWNADLGSYYRKVTAFSYDSETQTWDGHYDYYTDTFTGGKVTEEMVFDKTGYYSIIQDTYVTWADNEWGMTYDGTVSMYVTATGGVDLDDGGRQELLKSMIKTFADFDTNGHTTRSKEDNDLIISIQDNYEENGFKYSGGLSTNYNHLYFNWDIVFNVNEHAGVTNNYSFKLRYEDVGNLMNQYRK